MDIENMDIDETNERRSILVVSHDDLVDMIDKIMKDGNVRMQCMGQFCHGQYTEQVYLGNKPAERKDDIFSMLYMFECLGCRDMLRQHPRLVDTGFSPIRVYGIRKEKGDYNSEML